MLSYKIILFRIVTLVCLFNQLTNQANVLELGEDSSFRQRQSSFMSGLADIDRLLRSGIYNQTSKQVRPSKPPFVQYPNSFFVTVPSLTRSPRTDNSNKLTVQTSLGEVSGHVYRTKKGFAMQVFLGVPYAEPPKMFEKSYPKLPWNGVLNCSEYGNVCPQPDPDGNVPKNPTLDCLYLKILVPGKRAALLPVLFWVHGGGFSQGANSHYDLSAQGDNLVSKGVVIAQPTYRVGALGFWRAETLEESAEGNYGMWDILNALRFVKQEIRFFGGDPEQITLIGHGAGAVAASALTLSPLAKGLFAKAFLLSGTMFQPDINERAFGVSVKNQQFAKAAGCDDRGGSRWNFSIKSQVVNCLKSKSPAQLLEAQIDAKLIAEMTWHPTEDSIRGILPHSLDVLARNRPVFPVVMGSAAEETAWNLFVIPSIFTSMATRRKQIEFPHHFHTLNSIDQVRDECESLVTKTAYSQPIAIRELCKLHFSGLGTDSLEPNFYLKAVTNYWFEQAVKVGSTFLYHAPILKDLKFHLNNGNRLAYLYSFDYVRDENDWWRTAKSFRYLDAALLENFFPGNESYRFRLNYKDLYVRHYLTQSIVNFAKFANPSLTSRDKTQWDPLHLPDDFNYMSFDLPARMKRNYHLDNVLFWNRFVPLVSALTRHRSIKTSAVDSKSDNKTDSQQTVPNLTWISYFFPRKLQDAINSVANNKLG